MERELKEYLETRKIEYKSYEHPAVFTVKEHLECGVKLPCAHTKSLFLKDENNNFFLVCMDAYKRLDMKELMKILNVEHIEFGSKEELKQELNLTPGSVSIFGMIHSKKTTLLIDKSLIEAESVGFHPNINTATLELNRNNFAKFIASLEADKRIIEIRK